MKVCRLKKSAWGITDRDLFHGGRFRRDAAEGLLDLFFNQTPDLRPRFWIVFEGRTFPVAGKFFVVLKIFPVKQRC